MYIGLYVFMDSFFLSRTHHQFQLWLVCAKTKPKNAHLPGPPSEPHSPAETWS